MKNFQSNFQKWESQKHSHRSADSSQNSDEIHRKVLLAFFNFQMSEVKSQRGHILHFPMHWRLSGPQFKNPQVTRSRTLGLPILYNNSFNAVIGIPDFLHAWAQVQVVSEISWNLIENGIYWELAGLTLFFEMLCYTEVFTGNCSNCVTWSSLGFLYPFLINSSEL